MNASKIAVSVFWLVMGCITLAGIQKSQERRCIPRAPFYGEVMMLALWPISQAIMLLPEKNGCPSEVARLDTEPRPRAGESK